MKYQCLISDDEPTARKLLSGYVPGIPNLELAGVCSNGIEMTKFLQARPVDILLLDIRMPPLMTGIDVTKDTPVRPITIPVMAYGGSAAIFPFKNFNKRLPNNYVL